MWAPKYRKWVLNEAIRCRVHEVFQEIAHHHGFEIAEMEIEKDHVHLFLSFSPKYSIARVVEVFKSVSSKIIRKDFPGVNQQLWGGEFWEDGYFVRTVGDKVTTEIIRKYIRSHKERKHHPEQLDLF